MEEDLISPAATAGIASSDSDREEEDDDRPDAPTERVPRALLKSSEAVANVIINMMYYAKDVVNGVATKKGALLGTTINACYDMYIVSAIPIS